MESFGDRVSIVTGGASGIGRALCQELARRGGTVVVVDINDEGAEQVASAIAATGGQARAVHLDVAQAEAVQQVVDETVAEHGRLDYTFNNAGCAVTGEARDLTLEHWQTVLDTNLLGVINGVVAAYPVMVRQGFGHIVNTASLAGLLGYPINLPYATTKSAVIGLSTSLRAEGADLGVRVSVVCPGYVDTGIFDATPVIGADRDEVMGEIPFKLMEVTQAAQVILKGVARNQEYIVFPFYARLLWWLKRIHPSLLNWLSRQTVDGFRSVRLES